MYDPLFMALAQAESQPSHAFRAAQSALAIPEQAWQGYSQGLQMRRQLQQPEAFARAFNATPQGKAIIDQIGPQAAYEMFYGSNPADFMKMLGTNAELQLRGQLGYAGIGEREQASERAAQTARERTGAMESIFGGRNISQNIALHENAIDQLSRDNEALIAKLPPGVVGIARNWLATSGVMPQQLQDPQLAGIAGQLQSNRATIQRHQQSLIPMYKAQGMVPSGVLQSMQGADMGDINPPPAPGGTPEGITW